MLFLPKHEEQIKRVTKEEFIRRLQAVDFEKIKNQLPNRKREGRTTVYWIV